jgi:hypothetical protein
LKYKGIANIGEPDGVAAGRNERVAGVRVRLPLAWNRSRATALGATALLHLAVISWLLALKFDLPEKLAEELDIAWLPEPETALPPPPPVESELPPARVEPITAAPLSLPMPEFAPPAPPDWSAEARDFAKGLIAAPPYRPFGEFPKGPEERPKDKYPASIWPQPLPRVGTTVTTPEGETIIWVSDNCYISVSSRSLTLKGIHDGRNGIRTCSIPVGTKEARSDLFDQIKRPKPPQEPGCNGEGIGLSCAR